MKITHHVGGLVLCCRQMRSSLVQGLRFCVNKLLCDIFTASPFYLFPIGSRPPPPVRHGFPSILRQGRCQCNSFLLTCLVLTLPRLQVTPIRNNFSCPTFLIALAGPWIRILGNKVLTDFIWISGNPYNDNKLKLVTLAAVGDGITELEDFYSQISFRKALPDPQRFFPFIQHFCLGDHFVRFKYQAYLTRPSPTRTLQGYIFNKDQAGGPSKIRSRGSHQICPKI